MCFDSIFQWALAWTDEHGGAGTRLALPGSLEWRPVSVPCAVQNSPFGLPTENNDTGIKSYA
jgi:hypothetical protein